ncbi:MAG TPA: iron chelate uptake ABC transporter family permease subunit [Fulvivirga sp.]|nr:iron chelate uptake ABC transporter family permease subunit [Fulvivirga sp.]
METFIDFFSFTDPNVRYVVLGSILITASSAIVGTFTFLKKKALVGDAVAHAVLPGVCLSFIVYGEKNPLVLIIGAFITGWLALTLIDIISSKSKIKEDTAIGLILSVFFGVGIFLLTIIQKSGNAAQSGLDQFLFGKAASLVGSDLVTFSLVSVILLIAVYVFFKEFTLIAFDKDFASTIGLPIKTMELILTTLTVLAVVVGIQAVGVVLMAAMLITPAAAARFWTEKIQVMIWLAAIFGAFSGLSGAYISYVAPSMPTGPWIVIVISTIAFFSFFFAPKRGIIIRYLTQKRIQRHIVDENILKALYHLGEEEKNFFDERTIETILSKRTLQKEVLLKSLRRLKREGYLKNSNGYWSFTIEGKNRGQRVVKLHRLWEVYLTQYLRIAPDHVHDDADTIEHVLTPELEARLEKLLNYPTTDPHESEIPYA